jgi:RHS repeat-associated protein
LAACDSTGTNTYQGYAPHSERLQTDTNQYQGGIQAVVRPINQKGFNYDVAGNRSGGESNSNLSALQANQVGDTNYVHQDWWSTSDDDNHLRVMDRQSCIWDGQSPTFNCVAGPGDQVPALAETRFEDYYYDALGRRVLLRSRDNVHTPCVVNATSTHRGCFGAIERFVYDGDEVLYEIRMPGDDSVSSSRLERDTGGVATYQSQPDGYFALFGRVAYTNGLTLDHPLDLIRIGYDTVWPGAVALVPHVNWRGAYDLGTFITPNAGAQYQCKNLADKPTGVTCFETAWPARRFGYWGQDMGVYPYEDPWIGDIITGHRDVTNQMYLRNRYFDPETHTFTQEDPVGLAGGLNAYGFAHGDPVNYSDPFGLAPCPPDHDCDIGASDALAALTGAGRLLQPAQGPLEVGGYLATAPLTGGIGAAEEISGAVLALGSTLRSGAGSGILTAAGVAGRVAAATGGVVSSLAKSEGFKVTVDAGRAIVARIKSTGDIRVGIDGLGSLTREGVISSNRALTHLRNLTSGEIAGLVNKARELIGTPR